MKIRRLAASLVAIILGAHSSSAQEGSSTQVMLSIAKMAGACGILDSMIQLQRTTKLSGGEEFVTRFWSVEAARLGMTVEQLSQTCDESIDNYDRLWEAAEG